MKIGPLHRTFLKKTVLQRVASGLTKLPIFLMLAILNAKCAHHEPGRVFVSIFLSFHDPVLSPI